MAEVSSEKRGSAVASRLAMFTLLAILVCVLAIVGWHNRSIYRKAEVSSLHSYLVSVCASVERHYELHGSYPESLQDLNPAQLDAGGQFQLDDLKYGLTAEGYSVSSRLSYTERLVCGTGSAQPMFEHP